MDGETGLSQAWFLWWWSHALGTLSEQHPCGVDPSRVARAGVRLVSGATPTPPSPIPI